MALSLGNLHRELAYSTRARTAPFARHCTLEVNYDCQARCESCVLWTRDFKSYRIGDAAVLSTAELLGLIDDLAAHGCTSIFFCGGEPFIRKDLLALVEGATQNGIHSSTLCNGGLIRSGGLAERIVRSGMGALGFSLDGPTPAVNDRIRGLAGYFDQALAAIALVRAAREALASPTPALTLHCTVSSRNVELLPDMVSVARRAGVPAISFQYLSVVSDEAVESTNRRMGTRVAGMHNYGGVPRTLLLAPAQIDRLDGILAAVRTRARDEDVRVEMDSALAAPGAADLAGGRFPVTRCRAAWESAVITPTGDVHVCSMFTEYALGNVRREAIAAIWNGEAARRIRGELGRGLPAICQQCCQQHADADSTWDRIRIRARRKAPVAAADRSPRPA